LVLAAHAVVATGGELHAHVFESRGQGLERNVFWSVQIECAAIAVGDEQWPCAVSCDWLTWSLHDWEQLDGATLATVTAPEMVECSFYLGDHHTVRLHALQMARIGGTSRFRVALSGDFDLRGFEALDGTRIPLAVQADVEFTGVIVLPDSLSPKPSTPELATAVVGDFLATLNLGSPEWDRFRFVLAPAAQP
jgi:hypothetical protein